ncbi:MAG: GNAT family N-acetyltransferase [Gemmataceae bacterium]
MIQYRTFRNPDPPRLAEVWTASLAGPRTVGVSPRSTTLLEHLLLAKPYFDPQGMFLALDGTRMVGFALAGFGPRADGSGVDVTTGVTCAVGVLPSHRRQGIGSELLRRCEAYLKGRGATNLFGGPQSPRNPFTFALYGGADSPGVLDSYPTAAPFFTRHGYQIANSRGILQRQLDRMTLPGDPRFSRIRQEYDIVYTPPARGTWWQEAVIGPIEPINFQLQNKQTARVVARTTLWEMDLYRFLWNDLCVGMLDLEVSPEHRRQGLARYLVSQLLMHLNRQSLSLFEVQVDLTNEPARNLFLNLGFQQVDVGHAFHKPA